MADRLRIDFHSAAFRELLTGEGATSDGGRRAHAIADQATANAIAVGYPNALFAVHTRSGRRRAQSTVVTANPDAMRAEAEHKVLTRALDAGRS